MSSHANPRELGSGQKTIHEAVNSHRVYKPVTGIHPRVELPDPEFEDWLEGNRGVDHVFINFSEAEEVVERDGSLGKVLEPWHLPVILGTEEDEIVGNRSMQDILDLLQMVQPAVYVPDVAYSYRWMGEDQQEYAIEAYKFHVRDLQREVLDLDFNVRLVLTNKGWKFRHFKKYQDLVDRFDFTEFAFYAVQYTGGDAGNASRVMRKHLRNMEAALNPDNVFVIGRLGSDNLVDFDPFVRGATGLRAWTRELPAEEGYSQSGWPAWRDGRETLLTLNHNQRIARVNEFGSETEDH